jgi:hypothetical protein
MAFSQCTILASTAAHNRFEGPAAKAYQASPALTSQGHGLLEPGPHGGRSDSSRGAQGQGAGSAEVDAGLSEWMPGPQLPEEANRCACNIALHGAQPSPTELQYSLTPAPNATRQCSSSQQSNVQAYPGQNCNEGRAIGCQDRRSAASLTASPPLHLCHSAAARSSVMPGLGRACASADVNGVVEGPCCRGDAQGTSAGQGFDGATWQSQDCAGSCTATCDPQCHGSLGHARALNYHDQCIGHISMQLVAPVKRVAFHIDEATSLHCTSSSRPALDHSYRAQKSIYLETTTSSGDDEDGSNSGGQQHDGGGSSSM